MSSNIHRFARRAKSVMGKAAAYFVYIISLKLGKRLVRA
nr:MAG TPA: hypothetical protein [Caudoviricetes sp.]